MEDTQYELRAELRGHLEDVRAILHCDLGVVTASRDKTAKIWVSDGPCAYSCLSTLVGHSSYVTCLAYIPPGLSPEYPNGALVSGSRDTKVIVWDPVAAAPLVTLEGHTYQVTALGVLPTGEVVSGALDKVLKVWKGGKCVRTLAGHEGPVLCLAVLPGGDVLSGSGDGTIRQWQGATCVNTFRGHTDTVRGLATLPGVGFVSGSHDFTCKVWTLTGEVLSELIGHTALVYAVAGSADGTMVVSGSEDNTCRVWTAAGECLQVIEHVACVWDARLSVEGDILTACGDSIGRVWTKKVEHKAPAEVQEAYRSALKTVKEEREAAAKAQAEGGGPEGGAAAAGLPPGVKVEEPSALVAPGAKDGQHKFIREGGAVVAYTWDVKSWQWEKIGEVVSAPEASGAGSLKKMHKGQEWDFVFDVDIQEGSPMLKLACNRDENPYVVADRFIEEHGLPMEFKSQIVEFVTRNTGGAAGPALGDIPITGGFCDPFTGGSSSGPSANGGSSSRPPGVAPPASVPLSSVPITGGFLDPFSGAASGNAAAARSGSTFTHAPQSVYLAFDNVPALDKLGAKVREFNTQLASSHSTSNLALSEAEATAGLDALLKTLPATISPAGSPAFTPASQESALLNKLLHWPAAQLFPALDIARLVVLSPQGAATLGGSITASSSTGFDSSSSQPALVAALKTAAAAFQPGAEGSAAVQQLAVRLVANAFKHPQLRSWVVAERASLLDSMAAAGASANKAVRLSWATLLSNYSVLYRQGGQQAGGDQEEAKLQVLSALHELLGTCPTEDIDTLFRALVATATLLAGDTATREVAHALGVGEVLRRVHDSPESKTPQGRRLLEAAIDVTKALEGAK